MRIRDRFAGKHTPFIVRDEHHIAVLTARKVRRRSLPRVLPLPASKVLVKDNPAVMQDDASDSIRDDGAIDRPDKID